MAIDADIRGFRDEQLVGCIALAEMMLRAPIRPDDDPSQRETLARRLGMFRAEQAIRDDTASDLEKWDRIVREAQADGVNPF